MQKNSTFQFSEEQVDEMKENLKKYFVDELDVEISNLQADLLIDFLNQKIGKHYYNVGIMDGMAAMKDKIEDLVLLIKE